MAACLPKYLSCAGERITLGVDEALDFQNHLDVAAAIEALAGSALIGFELGKLRLPKAQDVCLKAADACDIADFEIETVGDGGRDDVGPAGELRGHGKDEEAGANSAAEPL